MSIDERDAYEIAAEMREMDDATKLLTLADACSDVLLGGECGWQEMEFNKFVGEVRKLLVDGVRYRHTEDDCEEVKDVPTPRPEYVEGRDPYEGKSPAEWGMFEQIDGPDRSVEERAQEIRDSAERSRRLRLKD